jgi:hypothetical protein
MIRSFSSTLQLFRFCFVMGLSLSPRLLLPFKETATQPTLCLICAETLQDEFDDGYVTLKPATGMDKALHGVCV